jgi:S-adenosylmethionine:tRNA ribosyltransferase-isomerase
MNQVNLDDPAAWHYELPPELIASRPAERRDAARLLVLDRASGSVSHRQINDLPALLQSGDLLVFNNTKVLPARMFGFRTDTGGKWEGLFLQATADGDWELLSETRGKLRPDETVTVLPHGVTSPEELKAGDTTLILRLKCKDDAGRWIATPSLSGDPLTLLDRYGSMPLPPYIGRRQADAEDAVRYQTCYATHPGAIAAPTAGLHFTPALIDSCRGAGAATTEVTLHVGIGTFRPMNSARVSDHQMHHEWCHLPQSGCEAIQTSRASGGRVIPVGTTSVRTLESAAIAMPHGLQEWQCETNLFIRPPFDFQLTDGLLTNFHLPGSTLLIMIAALAGYELVMEAYREAIAERYRFFSYGDAMLIL